MNKATYEKLQYTELKEMVKHHCASGLGKALLDQLEPSSQLKVVRNRLNETTEARNLLDAENHIPLKGISNITQHIEKIEKGMILDPGELVSIADFLRGCRLIKRFMENKVSLAPTLSTYVRSMTEFRPIEEEIQFAIKANRVASEASKELKKVRSQIEKTEIKIEDRLVKFLKNKSNKEYIQEFFISKKEDRFTIPIKASYKNHVDGTIVETSSKGSTVFMEPAAVTVLATELAALKAEESMEEYQILATLTGMLLEQIRPIRINIELVSQYDMIFAKAKFSKSMDAVEPKMNDHGYIALKGCRHPLLPKTSVPLDFRIGEDYRTLVITGPNAGGKTVVLKTVGLLTLAAMSGFHISGGVGTELAVFDSIFVDIGDNQSIENALSTFSSHMKNISDIMQTASGNTLVLFDEIGSGTEPNEGAALAIAILEDFYLKGCITVATTHYGEIKRYSEMHSDFMNAAMQFDSETLEPLYQLQIGVSGDSNALWIAKKMNVPSTVLEKAQAYMDNKGYGLERVSMKKMGKDESKTASRSNQWIYEVGDRVKLLEQGNHGIVYQPADANHNLIVFYEGVFKEVNVKRVELELKAVDLYPEGYDLDTLFVGYKDRKLKHDIERGSKKALKKVAAEIRKKLDE
ncbi:endonuclease MutS2 [Bacillus testis]|uniref:endonuclease MutS2 n=1 Tax=Bacillus testis TaxID=1622072 RepID=UPI00067F523F|nr:mannonate oxidoreductase [Bacillus testis]